MSDNLGEAVAEPIDVNAVRSQFPILSREVNGCRLVYLDSAASAQKPLPVINSISNTLSSSYANVHRGLHTLANEATEAMEAARATVGRFLGAASDRSIVFTKGGTEALNLIASSFVAPIVSAGDELILSVMEHHSNIVPWHLLRERHGVVLKWVGIDGDGNLDLEQLRSFISPRTKAIALTHVSNVLGTENPIEKVAEIAHSENIPLIVDGCQGAVHCDVDVQKWGIDFYVCTGHKLYGPSGIGILYGKPEHLEQMRPYQGGGEMIDRVSLDQVTYAPPPYRFEAGTPPIVEAISLGVALDWIASIGPSAIRQYEHSLLEALTDRLGEIPEIKIIRTAKNKAPIVSFTLANIHAHDIASILDQYGIAVRAGAHCAEPLMADLGLTSTCRASLGVYNTLEDIDDLVAGLIRVKNFFG